ncbi:hypothetical protein LR48_Vigan02g197900 [Vigna angularis]|uniref:Uncharacterized protein n=1 Tax=Phaseolus angularis TaxID=3914 RepID=A0A0L9U085_PHAAN|nr:hypothetical protein LR48_Vigan02g197900 [Vigna angularis]
MTSSSFLSSLSLWCSSPAPSSPPDLRVPLLHHDAHTPPNKPPLRRHLHGCRLRNYRISFNFKHIRC